MSNDKPTAGDTVNTYARQTAQGHQEALVTLTKRADTREKAILVESPWVIPVVFVPGVMGSNLKNKSKGGKVWRPPNGKAAELATLKEFYYGLKPKDRQKLFDPLEAVVDFAGPITVGVAGLSTEVLQARGWGSVHMDSYGGLLASLHDRFNSAIDVQTLLPTPLADRLEKYLAADPAQWGSISGSAKLTAQDIRSALRYRFEIWACGYNWLQSNQDSGKDLDAFVRATLKKYENPGGKPVAKKVILVTHSMGGLVVRGMLQAVPEATNRVLGVIHGVQPAAGAPAVYKRARAGFEGVASGIFGANAMEAVPEIANSPALLELLPFASYNDGKPWLSTSNPKLLSLPRNGDPFTEIYASTAWYGLIPENNTALIDPAGTVAKRIGPGKSVRENFQDVLKDVSDFQTGISKHGYHPQTHVHCSVEQSYKCWGQVRWDGYIDPEARNIADSSLLQDNLVGNIRLSGVGASGLYLSAPDQAGDGTVPAWSGLAPDRKPGVQSMFVHGQGSAPGLAALDTRRTSDPQAKALQTGYEHQMSYQDERAQWATAYGMVQLAKLADWAV